MFGRGTSPGALPKTKLAESGRRLRLDILMMILARRYRESYFIFVFRSRISYLLVGVLISSSRRSHPFAVAWALSLWLVLAALVARSPALFNFLLMS